MAAVNRMEIIKREKDGLKAIDDLYRCAKEGFESITADDFARFRWYGVYQQRPKTGHFMLRVNVPGGHYSSQQMRVLATISREYGRGFSDITTRQAYEFHWLSIQDIPDILERLQVAGLSTIGAGGDTLRNVTGCPVAGRDRREVFNARLDAQLVSGYFRGHRDYSNLPRKFKLSISACGINCCLAQINCIAFVGVPHGPGNFDRQGYNLYLGGGLSRSPHLARPVDIFVSRDQVLEVAVAVAEIFRDYGHREDRSRSRLKFMMDDWGLERFREEIARRISFIPPPASPHQLAECGHDHLGVFQQKEPGRSFIGIPIPVGRISAKQMLALADIADRYGSSHLANTCYQNLVIPDVLESHLPEAIDDIRAAGLTVEELSVSGDCVVCIGREFCNLAITETKTLMKRIIAFLEENLTWDQHIRIHMNGCPNACGHHQTADIGLLGTTARGGQERIEAYDFFVCGHLGEDAAFARKIASGIAADKLPQVIASLVRAYQTTRRHKGQTFRSWCSERRDGEIASLLGNGE
ncbi:MAG: nitrite/sulfite reductase [bacterium]